MVWKIAGLTLYLTLFLVWANRGLDLSAKRRPNVLFIVVDDLRPEIGAFGNPIVKTPNLDRLAEQSVIFERAYVQQPTCHSSRASFMTGIRPTAMCQGATAPGFGLLRKIRPNVMTLPQILKDGGYTSVGMGKIFHSNENDGRSWSKPFAYYEGGLYCGEENKEIVKKKYQRLIKEGRQASWVVGRLTEKETSEDNCHRDGRLTQSAIKELRKLSGKNKAPFFLAVGLSAPHLPFTAPRKYWDMYSEKTFTISPELWVSSGFPRYLRENMSEFRNYDDFPKFKRPGVGLSRKLIHGYYAAVSFVDAQIGILLDEVDRLGISENTIIVVLGDHGLKLGEHKSWGKHTHSEWDTRAPLMISVPDNHANGRSSESVVEFVDILPTIVELVGMKPPPNINGVSLTPLLEDPRQESKGYALTSFPIGHFTGTWMMGYSLRDGRYRYSEYYGRGEKQRVVRELYDHTVDPWELKNIYRQTPKALRAQLSFKLAKGFQLDAKGRSSLTEDKCHQFKSDHHHH